MKILYSCLSKSWGGMEMITLTFIRKLLERNYKVELICLDESRMQVEANNLGLIIHPVKASGICSSCYNSKNCIQLIKTVTTVLSHAGIKRSLASCSGIKNSLIKHPIVFTKHMGSFIVKKRFSA